MVNSLQLWQMLLLSLWAAVAMNEMLFTNFGFWERPLIAGVGAGLILGDLTTGLVVGATLEMMSLGVHSYGGAVVPDYTTGAVLGVIFGYLSKSPSAGITMGIPIALLATYTDVAGRTFNAFVAHRVDKAAADMSLKRIWRWHLFGAIPWGLSRAIPVFVGAFFGKAAAMAFINNVPQWLIKGFTAAGHAMPALGIGILLSFLPINKQWYFALLGFLLVAYLKLPMLAIGFFAVIIAVVYTTLYYKGNNSQDKESEEIQVGGEF